MLKLVSRFVLEVLPYVLSALIAAIVVPGFVNSQLHGTKPASAIVDSTVSALELVQQDHAAFPPSKLLSAQSSSAIQNQLPIK
jgi:N-acetylglucosamine-6-phosphate deacetylase